MGAAVSNLLRMRLSEALILLSLIALCFPTLAMVRLGNTILFPHYVVLALTLPVLFVFRPLRVGPIIPVLILILLSSVINIHTVSIPVAVFHSLHLVALALLASCPVLLALRFAKTAIMIYAVVILFTQALVALGFSGVVEGLLVQEEGLTDARVSGFATEPSYAGMIMLILGRYIIVCDINWMTWRRLVVIVGALMASLSLFSFLSATLVMAMYLLERRDTRALIGMFAGGLLMLVALSFTDFFMSRLEEIDLSLGLYGLNTGTTRLLPYLYMASLVSENIWPLIVGAGAGALDPLFFQNVGRFVTDHEHFATGMAGPIYDYGLPFVLFVMLSWNRPEKVLSRILFVVMAIMIMLNAGVGTYLFVLFGTFALLEQKFKNT